MQIRNLENSNYRSFFNMSNIRNTFNSNTRTWTAALSEISSQIFGGGMYWGAAVLLH